MSTATTAKLAGTPRVDAISGLMEQLHDSMGPTYHRLSNFTIAVDGDRVIGQVVRVRPSTGSPRRSGHLG